MKKNFSIILAVDDKNGLGKNGDLAWRLSSDMRYFKEITTKTSKKDYVNAVIMGRKTWESIPEKFKPLSGRINCILSKNSSVIPAKAGIYNGKNTINDSETSSEGQNQDILWFTSLKNCIKKLESNKTIENIFIIGGAKLYNNSLINPDLDRIYITKVKGDFYCDVFFNGIPNNFKLESKSKTKKEKDINFSFEIWKRK